MVRHIKQNTFIPSKYYFFILPIYLSACASYMERIEERYHAINRDDGISAEEAKAVMDYKYYVLDKNMGKYVDYHEPLDNGDTWKFRMFSKRTGEYEKYYVEIPKSHVDIKIVPIKD